MEKQRAQKRAEDKDLARLAEIRKKREEDAKRKEDEKKGIYFLLSLLIFQRKKKLVSMQENKDVTLLASKNFLEIVVVQQSFLI